MSQRPRILFFAEAVTLAHVARPAVLARSLDSDLYDIHFASNSGYDFVLGEGLFTRWTIYTIPSERFLCSLARGARLYDFATLSRYVAEDRSLIEEVRPDLVVGDFRLSLAVSAPLSQVPYATITNAHWSPYAANDFPMPELPMVKYLGLRLSSALFRLAHPVSFVHHARPLNKLRRLHGLEPLGDLRYAYTFADHTLFVDVPSLIPTHNLPANHHYIGPILWSPEGTLPDWWENITGERACIYVTLGSSGDVRLVSTIVKALSKVNANILLATAGRTDLGALPDNIWAADYLPGEQAAQRSALVICSGGSGTVYQALSTATPVLGIASNLDQYLTMRYVSEAGAGVLLRAGMATMSAIRQATERILTEPSYQEAAQNVAHEFSRMRATERFSQLVSTWL